MPISGVKSSLPEFGILAVQKRELIIKEVHKELTNHVSRIKLQAELVKKN